MKIKFEGSMFYDADIDDSHINKGILYVAKRVYQHEKRSIHITRKEDIMRLRAYYNLPIVLNQYGETRERVRVGSDYFYITYSPNTLDYLFIDYRYKKRGLAAKLY